MLEAVIAAIAVAAAIVALCVVLYRRWAESHGVRSGTVDEVQQVSTFGVGTSVIDDPTPLPRPTSCAWAVARPPTSPPTP